MMLLFVGIFIGVAACVSAALALYVARGGERAAHARIRERSDKMYREYVAAEQQRERIQRIADKSAIDGIVGVSTWEQPRIYEDHS